MCPLRGQSLRVSPTIGVPASAFGGIPPCPPVVSEVSQLPRMYASLQVLIDENNRIAAVAFEGGAGLKAKDGKGAGKERLRQLDEQTVN